MNEWMKKQTISIYLFKSIYTYFIVFIYPQLASLCPTLLILDFHLFYPTKVSIVPIILSKSVPFLVDISISSFITKPWYFYKCWYVITDSVWILQK
jgi:hypothetical protein